MVEQLKDEELDAFVLKHDIVLLDIFTTWCGPCKRQAAVLEEVAKEVNPKQVAIVKMDADECTEASTRFKVTAIPTLVIFKKGKPVKSRVGLTEKADLLKELAALKK
jgi:thioredoxin 1